MGTLGWLAFDVFSIVSSLWAGKDMVLQWFRDNPPTDPDELEKFDRVVGNLSLTWDVLIYVSVGSGLFMAWTVFSYWNNRGKRDWPTARIVRRIPLIGGYLRDLSFADSMAAAARMLQGNVPIGDMLIQSSEASSAPDVAQYWDSARTDLGRGISLGAALDRPPLTRSERLEVASLSDLDQVAKVMWSISEMRAQAAKTKHSMIVWLAFALTGVFLAIAFGSAIYALTVMNISTDSMVSGLLEGSV